MRITVASQVRADVFARNPQDVRAIFGTGGGTHQQAQRGQASQRLHQGILGEVIINRRPGRRILAEHASIGHRFGFFYGFCRPVTRSDSDAAEGGHLAVCKVAISLRRDAARPRRFAVRSRLIVTRHCPSDLCDTIEMNARVPRSGFFTTERDGYFLCPLQTVRCTPAAALRTTAYARPSCFRLKCSHQLDPKPYCRPTPVFLRS